MIGNSFRVEINTTMFFFLNDFHSRFLRNAKPAVRILVVYAYFGLFIGLVSLLLL